MPGGAGILLIGLHNPVEMAEVVASLGVIWGGRFVFGIGLGYRDVEFDAFKVPRGQRVRRFEACLEVVKRLWTEESVTVDNDVCTLAGVTLTCRPVQRPHPPIWVAANNDSAIRRAARIGDTWFINPHATMTTVARQMDVYRDELARVGKPFPGVLPIFKEIYCAKDRATAGPWPGPILAANTRSTPRGAKARPCPPTRTSGSPSSLSSRTASCSAARRNATSSSVHAGRKWGRRRSSCAPNGSACPPPKP